jgi:hypothetical protein
MNYRSYSGVIFCTDRDALHRVLEYMNQNDTHDADFGHAELTIVEHDVKGRCYSLSYYEQDYAPMAHGAVDSDTVKNSKYIEHTLAGLAWRWDVHDNQLGDYLKTTSYAWDALLWNGDPFETKMALAVIQLHNAY